jgi:hypothetical protein
MVPKMTAVERLSDRVVVTFEDGKYGIFSEAFLYEVLPQAQQVAPEDELGPEYDE